MRPTVTTRPQGVIDPATPWEAMRQQRPPPGMLGAGGQGSMNPAHPGGMRDAGGMVGGRQDLGAGGNPVPLVPGSPAAQVSQVVPKEPTEMEKIDAEAQRLKEKVGAGAIMELAGHARMRWGQLNEDRRTLTRRMEQNERQRRAQHEPEQMSRIQQEGGSKNYDMMTSTKCRAAASWIVELILGVGPERPWGLKATPSPDVPGFDAMGAAQEFSKAIAEEVQMTGIYPTETQLMDMATTAQERAQAAEKEESDRRIRMAEKELEDALIEGDFRKAMNDFVENFVTFPFAVMKRVTRKIMVYDMNGTVSDKLVEGFEAPDPGMIYFPSWAKSIHDAPFIQRHKMSLSVLAGLRGMPGYSDTALNTVIERANAGSPSLASWCDIDLTRSQIYNKPGFGGMGNASPNELIDAIQLWDAVPGKMLRQWGMPASMVPDMNNVYKCEIWLVDDQVIRARLNNNPMKRIPYYISSFEKLPGTIEGNGVPDLCRNSQMTINAALLSLVDNMAIASGPQVWIDRMQVPDGEVISEMFPWKIWQTRSDAQGQNRRDPMSFFQPNSNAAELNAVAESYRNLADDDTMLPKYMAGGDAKGVRAASHMSMLMSNAGKSLKRVVTNLFTDIMEPMLQDTYMSLRRHGRITPEMVGDTNVMIEGAAILMAREAEAMRTAEFLNAVVSSPALMNIVPVSGLAEILRKMAQGLNLNIDKIVPDDTHINALEAQRQQMMQLEQQNAMLQAQMGMLAGGQQGQPSMPSQTPRLPDGMPQGGMQGMA